MGAVARNSSARPSRPPRRAASEATSSASSVPPVAVATASTNVFENARRVCENSKKTNVKFSTVRFAGSKGPDGTRLTAALRRAA